MKNYLKFQARREREWTLVGASPFRVLAFVCVLSVSGFASRTEAAPHGSLNPPVPGSNRKGGGGAKNPSEPSAPGSFNVLPGDQDSTGEDAHVSWEGEIGHWYQLIMCKTSEGVQSLGDAKKDATCKTYSDLVSGDYPLTCTSKKGVTNTCSMIIAKQPKLSDDWYFGLAEEANLGQGKLGRQATAGPISFHKAGDSQSNDVTITVDPVATACPAKHLKAGIYNQVSYRVDAKGTGLKSIFITISATGSGAFLADNDKNPVVNVTAMLDDSTLTVGQPYIKFYHIWPQSAGTVTVTAAADQLRPGEHFVSKACVLTVDAADKPTDPTGSSTSGLFDGSAN